MSKIKSQSHKEAIRRTPFGLFPSEWEVNKLSNISKISTGLTPLRSKAEYFADDVFWVKTTDLNNSLIFDTEEKISYLALQETSIKMVEPNSILIAMYGGFNQIGRTGLMKIKGTTNQAISSFYIDEVEYHSEYVLYWLNNYRHYWRKFAASSRKDPNITKKDVEDFPIIKPKYEEQKKIASILSVWDKAMDLKEKMIEQKKEQKKGLTMKLFTGEVRLSGFEGEVKKKSLKGLLKENTCRNTNNEVSRILSVTNLKGFIEQSDQFGRQIASQDLTPYKIVREGQFAYNPSRVNVGSIDLLRKFKEGLLSPMYVVFDTDQEKLLPEYLYHFIKSDLFIKRLGSFLQGSVRQSLSFGSLELMKLYVPESLNEQRAIAKVLSNFDYEISILEKELMEYNIQKRGLMQNLLTGNIRVKV